MHASAIMPTGLVERVRVKCQLRGAARDLFRSKDKAVCISGPAGTGKTTGALHLEHLRAAKYPNSRHLFIRKTRASMTQTVLVTFEKEVLHSLDGVKIHGGSAVQEYRYPNGAVIVAAGMDDPGKVMSGGYDTIYVNQGEELGEDDVQTLVSRLRNAAMPYHQLILDVNPSFSTHWIRVWAQNGRLRFLESRHRDNPAFWDTLAQDWTPRGRDYMATLDLLTGVRRARLRDGLWVSAEGMVYEEWDPAIHIVDRFPIPREWPRYWSVDFGFTNPFSWSAWAEDGDGRLYRYRQIYRTGRLVEDHARDMLAACGWQWTGERHVKLVEQPDPLPLAIVCDHDAEGRATLERHLGLRTAPAFKAVKEGIQAVKTRLKVAGDGKPRLMFLRDSLVDVDPALADAKKPTCTDQEFESYVWNPKRPDEPVKESDHGLDEARYMVAFADDLALEPFGGVERVTYEPDYVISPY